MDAPACVFCNLPVDPDSRETWHSMAGWERPGKAGGSDVALRARTGDGRFACDPCIRRQQEGLSPLQTSLS